MFKCVSTEAEIVYVDAGGQGRQRDGGMIVIQQLRSLLALVVLASWSDLSLRPFLQIFLVRPHLFKNRRWVTGGDKTTNLDKK